MEGKRNTVQRQIIYGALKELDIHASAEQVFEYVKNIAPSIGKATVYRNLRRMAEEGEIMSIGNLTGSMHYDHNCHTHYHCVCDNCMKIFDVEEDFSEVMGKAYETEGFDIKECAITFKGLCWQCRDAV
ncbi:MAG: transcriptional repressor [Defluviitaleaceae bacterium]|nr:transcriptional repressor [Defluviitaleaceae bacterium]